MPTENEIIKDAAVKLLTDLGYTVTPPVKKPEGLSLIAKSFCRTAERYLATAKDETDRHDAVYRAYDAINHTWGGANWNIIWEQIKEFAPDTYKLAISSRLIKK